MKKYLITLPTYGEQMTIDEWIDSCNFGAYTEYDGYGCLAYKDKMSDINIWPSMIKSGELEKIRDDFTHIVWFNK